MAENIILEKTFRFSLMIIEFCEELQSNRKYVIADQLLRSGTSIGANIREAQNSESNSDFIHKFKIAAKEADETEYWLLLCQASKSYPFNSKLLCELIDIKKIITKIISTSNKHKIVNRS